MGSTHKIAILTLISNAKGIGPGHSALVVHGSVYSFEVYPWQAAFDDGWKMFTIEKYLEQNAFRPVVVQELTEQVDIRKAASYVSKSMQNDDDYIGSGVCSSQVASAMNAATARPAVNGKASAARKGHKEFNPTRVDTPREVYLLAAARGLVKRSYCYWAGESDLSPAVCMILQDRMEKNYAGVRQLAPKDGVHTW